ncbi:MAG: S28 family serine protease [Candidatus Egerieousia sp.]
MKQMYKYFKGVVISIALTTISFSIHAQVNPASAQKTDLSSLAGVEWASSPVDSLVLEDFNWCNRYVLPGNPCSRISDVERLPVGDRAKKYYKSKYRMFITQPIDHKDPSKGLFKQRVTVCFAGFKRPNVIVTEGYVAHSGHPNYTEELSTILDANVIEVEHRYFNESVPFMQDDSTITWETLNWDYMTAEQEAADLHEVVQALSHLFYSKWVATGISKGGQNCMAYASFYPKDCAAYVPYVGPVARAVVDGRHEPFLKDSTGTVEDRAKIFAFQNEILSRRASMEKLLKEWSDKRNITYNISIPEVLDYTVMEFPFAFWQWGRSTSTIPDLKAGDKELFDYLELVAGSEYFQKWDSNAPFFVQAAKELGYYGYDPKPFKGKLVVKKTDDYLRRIFLPGQRKFKFDKSLYNRLTDFIATTDTKMMFIYGQWDPWSSVRPDNPGHENIKYYVGPGGSHRARINNLPEDMKNEAVKTLKEWLGVKD